MCDGHARTCSHDGAVLIFCTLLQLAFLVARWQMGLTRGGSLNDQKALFRSLLSMVGSFDVPDVCF